MRTEVMKLKENKINPKSFLLFFVTSLIWALLMSYFYFYKEQNYETFILSRIGFFLTTARPVGIAGLRAIP